MCKYLHNNMHHKQDLVSLLVLFYRTRLSYIIMFTDIIKQCWPLLDTYINFEVETTQMPVSKKKMRNIITIHVNIEGLNQLLSFYQHHAIATINICFIWLIKLKVVVLYIAAMYIYRGTEDLSRRNRHRHPPVSGL